MEISAFLQQSATWNLRKAYLESVRQKHSGIVELLKLLLNSNSSASETPISPAVEKRTALSNLFNEVHRLKGSGGTYGFNEISWIYKEIISYIRAANESKTPLDFSDAQKALETAMEFSKYFPLLYSSFQSTDPAATHSHSASSQFSASVLFVNEDRPTFMGDMERFFVKKTKAFFTTQGHNEALEALKILKPRWLIVNVDILETCGLNFLRELTQQENAKDANLAMLLKTPADKNKKELLEIKTDALFFEDMPIESLLEEIESWILKIS